jgi:hypothetical protein
MNEFDSKFLMLTIKIEEEGDKSIQKLNKKTGSFKNEDLIIKE